ncbi:NADP-dependent 3-hydroxy acid dehydrogenase [Yamadazyma tenuis]|uniref:NAD(P)-binding protein n=1 Tax=Candida tenuis (strain ATCC 10573 / BCRC 21748 / CBS 615 / JCM 9827 / NBRC 10315 / NRRL Y-1498 / VKM Y-70) TaxID=590646 RepID=G3B8Q0_CANTC|nr:NAD(P)-binding protein [Yamadazyma tenuis ATCC 10573]EGV62407.1 NAD(P)-binding protein [Yamadazyma tenuis ATCC 10573]WEJ93676.1 NADP-dependent 3-hydroxy acid dehydrogenase [Yamadazyma tenuis]
MSFGPKAAQRLANKVVLITGASSGIGEATAREFASAANGNISLILAARREDKLTTLKADLIQQYPEIKVLSRVLDVSKTSSILSFVKGLPEDFADVSVLVNNAGKALGRSEVGQLKAEDVSEMLDTNVLGLITLTNALLPHFRAKNRGDIVNVGSIAGREAYPGGSIYCASKAAIRAFTGALRKETINSRIRVLEVDPGAVLTEFSVVRNYGDKAAADKVYEDTEPLGPEDIAEAIVFGVTRNLKVVIAETLIFPTHQAGAGVLHRGSLGQ